MINNDDIGPLFFVEMEIIFKKFVGRVILEEINVNINIFNIQKNL